MSLWFRRKGFTYAVEAELVVELVVLLVLVAALALVLLLRLASA